MVDSGILVVCGMVMIPSLADVWLAESKKEKKKQKKSSYFFHIITFFFPYGPTICLIHETSI